MSTLEFPLPKRLTWQRQEGYIMAYAEDYCCTIEKFQIGARLRIRRPRFITTVVDGKKVKTLNAKCYDGGYASVNEAKARTLHVLKLLQGPVKFQPTKYDQQ